MRTVIENPHHELVPPPPPSLPSAIFVNPKDCGKCSTPFALLVLPGIVEAEYYDVGGEVRPREVGGRGEGKEHWFVSSSTASILTVKCWSVLPLLPTQARNLRGQKNDRNTTSPLQLVL